VRQLLLIVGSAMAVIAALELLACLVIRAVRTRIRARVQALISGRVPERRPRSRRLQRAALLEWGDRLTGAGLRAEVPWTRRVAGAASRDLQRRSWVKRARGLRTLQALGVGNDQLLRLLADRDARVRALAATVASGYRHPALLRALVAMLEDAAPYVRYAALDALGRRSADSSPAVEQALLAIPVLSSRGFELAAANGAVPVALPAGGAPGLATTLPRPLRPMAVLPVETRTLLLLLRAASATEVSDLVSAVGRFLRDDRPEVGPRPSAR
jgi:hypothetical protein